MLFTFSTMFCDFNAIMIGIKRNLQKNVANFSIFIVGPPIAYISIKTKSIGCTAELSLTDLAHFQYRLARKNI